jgi:3'(2'), 5'-bisphosphate nucleotidase
VSLLDNVLSIARKAGEKILETYQSDNIETLLKDDHSPLTQADLASNQFIISSLKQISCLPIITEEAPVDFKDRQHWDKFWLVDPLDGTKDFLARNGGFTVNIALIESNKPVLGVVHLPVGGDSYFAEKGKGAHKNGSKIANNSKRTELIAARSVFHSNKASENFFDLHDIRDVRKFGSSIKICKLAEGEIDVYPRLNGTKEWDTAASHVIANEAKCKLVDITTKEELVYNKPSIRNKHFIASRQDLNFI